MGKLTISNTDTAKDIMVLMIEIYRRLNESLTSVQETCPNDEFIAYRRAVAAILGHDIYDVVHAICEQHPLLKPEGLFE